MIEHLETLQTLDVRVERPFLYVTFNRPDVRNALNQQMIDDLRAVFSAIHDDRSIRAVLLSGAGGTFCAGGDLQEMQAAYTDPHAASDTTRTETFDMLLRTIDAAPQVVIAQVEGAAMGGGLGIVAVSDVAIAEEGAVFAMPEVRLGIIPALIAPYVIERIGITHARRLMLTGLRFSAAEARDYNLVHEVVSKESLKEQIDAVLSDVRQASPEALAACKALLFRIINKDLDATPSYRAQVLNDLRRSAAGQEGMMAFIQKRRPAWAQEGPQ